MNNLPSIKLVSREKNTFDYEITKYYARVNISFIVVSYSRCFFFHMLLFFFSPFVCFETPCVVQMNINHNITMTILDLDSGHCVLSLRLVIV